ncbi:MAG: hypothetical protein J5I59_03775 [Saprospiraceae bacterium]|nr:hypothetical protein [Saprospiraceae bacterium]
MRCLFLIVLLLHAVHIVANNGDISVRLEKIKVEIFKQSDLANAESELLQILSEVKHLPKTKDNLTLTLKAKLIFCQVKNIQLKYDEAISGLLEIVKTSRSADLPEYTYQAYLEIAIIKEFYRDFKDARKYLASAQQLTENNNLDTIISTYFVRMASFYRFLKKNDSAVIMANQGLQYALKNGNEKDENDCYLLLGMTLPTDQYHEAISYYKKAANYFKKISDYPGIIGQYGNIAKIFLNHNLIDSSAYYYQLAER